MEWIFHYLLSLFFWLILMLFPFFPLTIAEPVASLTRWVYFCSCSLKQTLSYSRGNQGPERRCRQWGWDPGLFVPKSSLMTDCSSSPLPRLSHLLPQLEHLHLEIYLLTVLTSYRLPQTLLLLLFTQWLISHCKFPEGRWLSGGGQLSVHKMGVEEIAWNVPPNLFTKLLCQAQCYPSVAEFDNWEMSEWSNA